MKICFAVKAVDDIKGGAERVLADVSSGLADLGHDVVLVTFDKKHGQSFYPLNPKIRHINLALGHPEKPATFFETLQRIAVLRRTFLAERPDVAIGFMHSMFVPLAFALMGTGIPLIGSEHIVPDHYKSRKVEFGLFLLSSFFLKKITVLSRSIKNTYPSLLKRKMVVIGNPVHQVGVTVSTRENPVILNVGRLDPQKDQETLIRSFALIAASHPEWTVRIIGGGELKSRLEGVIAETGMTGRVILAGTTNEISLEYTNASIFALTSKYESFGLATAEAMAHGLPAIGFSDCPGTNELIVDGRNGLLVDGGQDRAKAFAVALENLILSQDKRREMGRHGQQSVQAFAPEGVVTQWDMLAKEVAG